MPSDDITPTTPGVLCASYPSNKVLPISASERDRYGPTVDHTHRMPTGRDPPEVTTVCNGRLIVPSTDRPGSALPIHTDQVNAALALWLADATGTPGNDLLTIKEADTPKARGVTGTGEELADIARAVLAYVEQPCEDPACGVATMPGECPTHNPNEEQVRQAMADAKAALLQAGLKLRQAAMHYEDLVEDPATVQDSIGLLSDLNRYAHFIGGAC